MNQDEINAQNQQPNDEQRQQIRAERKLFGGIIKKGDMFQSTLNIVLLIILLPLMLIQELYYRIIDLTFYLKDKFFELIDFLQVSILSILRWITKTYNQIVEILKIVIKKVYNALEDITQIITKYTKLIVTVIYEKTKYVLDKIINIISLITEYVLDKLYIFAEKCITAYKMVQDFVVKWFMIIFNKIKTCVLVAIQFISEKASKIWNYVTIKFEQFCQFVFEKIKQLCKILYDIILYVTDKLVQFCEYIKQNFIIPLTEQFIKLSKFLKNKFLELILFFYDQVLIFLEWIKVQLAILREKITKFMIWLKTKVVLFTLCCIDELLKFCYKLKNQVIQPSAGFIKRISEYIIEHVKNILIKIINNTIKGLKFVIKMINAVKKRFFSAGSHNFKGKMKLKIQILTDFSYKKGTIIYQSFSKILHIIKLRIIKLAQTIKQIIKQTIKYLIRKIVQACKIIRENTLKLYHQGKKYTKMAYRGVKRIIFKSFSIIKKIFKYFLETFCKVIIKFITIFKILEIINFITDIIFEKCFQIFLLPQIILEKISALWISFIFVLMPKITAKICYGLFHVGYKIVRQTKKVSMIIKQKIIDPVVYCFIYLFKVCKECYGIVKEKIINFWGWMKYDYILPAWASIRLFAVEVKKTTLRAIFYCKQKYQQAKTIVIEIFVQIKQFFIKIWAFVVAQFVLIKDYLLSKIKIASGFVKMSYQILKQKIIEITKILIQPIILLKNRIVQSILTLKQVGEEIMNQLKEKMVQRRIATRQKIQQILIQIQNLKAGIQESLIQTQNDVKLRMNLMAQNIKQQMQQQKQNLISLKNEIVAAIKSVFKRN